MPNKILTYRDVRRIFSKEETADLVAYGLLKPIEKTNTKQAWKFHSHDVTPDLYGKLFAKRNKIQAKNCDELLAKQIEDEWKITSSSGMVHRKGWKTTT